MISQTRRFIRNIAVAFLAPVVFSVRTGHWRSALRDSPGDRQGRPVPWLTYPANEFLRGLDLSDAAVLEYGAGNSTLWFAARARSVVSYENAPQWANKVRRALAGRANAVVVDSPYSPPTPDGVFDIVLVDGLDRYQAALRAIAACKDDGLIIFDNAEGDWGAPGTAPIIDAMNQAGLMRVDFFGLSPGNWRPHCTSIFFRANCRFLKRQPRPMMGD